MSAAPSKRHAARARALAIWSGWTSLGREAAGVLGRARAVSLTLLCLLLAGYRVRGAPAPVSPDQTVKPAASNSAVPDGTVKVDHVDGATRIDAALPGKLLATAFPKSPDGRRQIAMLVRPTASAGQVDGTSMGGVQDKTTKTKGGGTQVTFSVGPGGADVAVEPAPEHGDSNIGESDADQPLEGAGAGTEQAAGESAAGATPKRAPGSGSKRTATKAHSSHLWLLWLDPSPEARIATIRRDLPSNTRAIDALDTGGDGTEELVLWRPGAIDALLPLAGAPASGAIKPLVADPEIQPQSSSARALCDPHCDDAPMLWAEIVGALRGYGPMAAPSPLAPTHEARPWGIVSNVPLPVSAKRSGGMLTLSSGALHSVPPAADSGRLAFVGPTADGKDRLRTLMIDPSLPADRSTTECWSLLPGPERLIESAYLRIDGRPALVVTTRSAEKLGIFSEKWLRVFFLKADRTRRGLPPAVALETRINLWQAASPIALDVDHDGRQDLVLGYWKGLKNHHLVLDAYLQKDDGTFGSSARTTTFEVEQADRSFLSYGHDVDGDGLADLVLLAGNRMLVYPGSAKANKGSDLVAEKARWTFPLSPEGTIHINGVKSGDNAVRQGSGSRSESKSDSDADSEADDQAESGGDDFDIDSDEPARPTAGRDGRPMFFDFDGDGAEEVFFSTDTLGGGSHLLVFRFPKAAQGP